MSERLNISEKWQLFYSLASKRVGENPDGTLWQKVYNNQILLTEIELKNLGVRCETRVGDIPNINNIQNFKRINPIKEFGLVEVVGMPGAGKDTIIKSISERSYHNIECAAEEGYTWDRKEPPFANLSQRHFRAYGGTDMEIDEVVDRLKIDDKNLKGVGILNRSIQDNFLAFGYAFFLDGRMSVKDLLISQKIFHYYQYSPRFFKNNKSLNLEDATVATVICMVDPKKSLERIPRRGRILNEDFLSLLYIQYLRMISRLSTMKQKNLVVLDMSGTKEDNNKLFSGVIDKIVKLK